MSLDELVYKWSNTWRFDYWWRQKYKVPFNSEAHRNANPIDVKFEYIEDVLIKKQMKSISELEEKQKLIAEGKWINENIDHKKQKELFDKVDISQF